MHLGDASMVPPDDSHCRGVFATIESAWIGLRAASHGVGTPATLHAVRHARTLRALRQARRSPFGAGV